MSFRSLHLGPTTINNALAPPLLPRSSSPLPHGGATSPMLASGSKQAYICRDCGFIYNDRTPFDKLPDNVFVVDCVVCGAPKRRFRPYEMAVNKNANSTDVRKARKQQIKKDESTEKALPYAIAVGIIALVGLYFYLNSAF